MTSLAACGGSSSNVDMTPTVPTGANGFQAVQQRGLNLAERFGPAIETSQYTNLRALPTTGTLNYSGSGAYVLGSAAAQSGSSILANADAISRVDLQVRLNDGRVTGSASEFYDTETRAPIGGRLAIRGALDRTTDTSRDYGINGTINGTLQSPTDGQVSVQTDMVADLYGPNAGFLFGYADGFATTAQGRDSVQGAFIAERN